MFVKYLSGEDVFIGDLVLADKSRGTVVCVIDAKQFSKEHPEEQWSYLEKGIMIETEELGLVHYPMVDEDVIFLDRKDSTDSTDTDL